MNSWAPVHPLSAETGTEDQAHGQRPCAFTKEGKLPVLSHIRFGEVHECHSKLAFGPMQGCGLDIHSLAGMQ